MKYSYSSISHYDHIGKLELLEEVFTSDSLDHLGWIQDQCEIMQASGCTELLLEIHYY